LAENELEGRDKQSAAFTFTKAPLFHKFGCLAENELKDRNEQGAVFSFGKGRKILAEIAIEQNINTKHAEFAEKINSENIFAYPASRR